MGHRGVSSRNLPWCCQPHSLYGVTAGGTAVVWGCCGQAVTPVPAALLLGMPGGA